jgi:hypothetical protein
MKIRWNGLLMAGLLVVVTNGVIGLIVARNRSGAPVAEFELTERELRLQTYGQDNSGVALTLVFTNPAAHRSDSPGPSRKVYLALEYDETRAPAGARDPAPRLTLIDVGPDAAALRRKYPDARKVILLPGATRGQYDRAWARLAVNWIHVPLPASRALKGASRYRVRLRQGPSLELWVAEVQRIVG